MSLSKILYPYFKQLEEINKKLSNVIRKDNGFLRDLIKVMFQQMKAEFLG